MAEQRASFRHDVSMVAEVNTGQAILAAKTRNLSMSGVRVVVPQSLKEGAHVGLQLFLVNTEGQITGPLDLEGHIVWANDRDGAECEAGIKFDNVSPEQGKWLQRFLAQRVVAERCVLVVEDSPTMRQLLRVALRRSSLKIIEAENGLEAFEALKRQRVDLILLDLKMPGMGGLDFLRRFADFDAQRPPVVVLTTEGDQTFMDQADELGASAYITKPIQSSQLASKVEQLLDEQYALKPIY